MITLFSCILVIVISMEPEEYYINQPVIDEGLADFFVEKNIKMLGMDLPSPDNYPFEIHKKLFANNILIVENLTIMSL